jgi:hypothetical protein
MVFCCLYTSQEQVCVTRTVCVKAHSYVIRKASGRRVWQDDCAVLHSLFQFFTVSDGNVRGWQVGLMPPKSLQHHVIVTSVKYNQYLVLL